MKCILIDDSYFQASSFLKTMRKRLFSYCLDHEVSYILIGGAVHERDEIVATFFHDCEQHGITIVKSPAVIEFDHGIEGVLSFCSLTFQDGRSYHPYSGSAYLIDTETNYAAYIYFDLFPHADIIESVTSLEEELIKMLNEAIDHAKKSTKHHYH